MKTKTLIMTLAAICCCVLSASAVDLTVKMNSVSRTMKMVSKATGETMVTGDPDRYIYNFEASPGEYLITGYASDGSTENGTIEVVVGDSVAQQITILTLTAYVSNRDADGRTWTYDDGDFTIDLKVNSREGVVHHTTLGNSTTKGRKTFLTLNGDTYYAAFIPNAEHQAEGYVTLHRTATLTGNVNVTGTIPIAHDFSITLPKDAKFDLGMKFTHFVDFTPVEPVSTEAKGDSLVLNYRLAESQVYNYRTWMEGAMTLGGYFTMSKDESKRPVLKFTEADYKAFDPHQINHSCQANDGFETGDIFVNINPKGYLRLNVGDTYDAHAMRTWQLTENSTNNYFIEPDFHYTVIGLDGKPSTGILDTETKVGSAWTTLKAKAPGTVIVLVTYDAIGLNFFNTSGVKTHYMGGEYWGAIWPENTAAYVVSVGQPESDVDPQMLINEEYNTGTLKMAGKFVDSEHDVFYYLDTEEGHAYTFTAPGAASVTIAYPTIGERMATYTGFGQQGVTANGDGSYTVLLKEGRQIVRLTDASGNATYQVLTAKKTHREVVNVNRPKSKIFQPGDEVAIRYSGLRHPANKLAGIYNMSAYVTYNGTPNGTSLILSANQYTFGSSAKAQTVSFTIPADHDVAAEPQINFSEGVLQVNGYGDPIGNHRTIDPKAGRSPNFTAVPHKTYFGYIPDVVLDLRPVRMFDIKLNYNVPDGNAVMSYLGKDLEPGENGLYNGTYGLYNVVTAAPGYRCQRLEFSIDDDAEGLQTFNVEPARFDGDWYGTNSKEPVLDEQGYYTISTAAELAWFRDKVNTDGQNIKGKLTHDIDLGDYAWTPIGSTTQKSFAGELLGGGHTVKGLYIDSSNANYQGLFGCVKGTEAAPARISGITVYGQVSGKQTVAGLAAYITDYVQIDSCANYATVRGTATGVGGLVGVMTRTTSSISNCYNAGDVYGPSNHAGIVGNISKDCDARISNVFNVGEIEDFPGASAIAAHNANITVDNIVNAYAIKDYKLNTGYTLVTPEIMASGEVAFKLGPVFGQTIGTDPWPVFGGKEVRYDASANRYYNVPDAPVDFSECVVTMNPGDRFDAKTFWKEGISVEYGMFGCTAKNTDCTAQAVMTLDGKQIGASLSVTDKNVRLLGNTATRAISDEKEVQYLLTLNFLEQPGYDAAPGTYEITIPAGYFTIDGAPMAEYKHTWTIKPNAVDITPLVSSIEPGSEMTVNEMWQGSVSVSMEIAADLKRNPGCEAKAYMTLDGAPIGEALAISSDRVIVGGKGEADPLADGEELITPVTFVFLTEDGFKPAPGRYEMSIPAGFFTVNGAENLTYTHSWDVEKPVVVVAKPTADPAEGNVDERQLARIALTPAEGQKIDALNKSIPVLLYNDNESIASISRAYSLELDGEGHIILTATESAAELALGSYRLVLPAGVFSVEETLSPEFSYTYAVVTNSVDTLTEGSDSFDIYTLSGMIVKLKATSDDVKALVPGLYIINGHRVIISN